MNEECIYDVLPKRRGPDKIQRARTSGTRQKTDEGPPTRRGGRHPTDTQAVGESRGIMRKSRATAKRSVLDTFEDLTLIDHPRQYGARVHTQDPMFELLESSAIFSEISPHNQMFMFDPTSIEHNVSRLFLLLWTMVDYILAFRRESRRTQ